MVIHSAHKMINALRQALPESFVFVLDTTDRSFLYKSSEDLICEREVLAFDQKEGIDRLLREKNTYLSDIGDRFIALRSLGAHTFLGFCVDAGGRSQEANLERAKQIICD